MIGSNAGDACPSCGAQMALDQRYCLNCGSRRGDPRLPFMDAVVFMESSKQPPGEAAAAAPEPPPQPAKSGMSPSTTLIAGIATLVLAVGVGVLIGRSGNDNSAPVANQAPQIIKVGGGGGEGEEPEAKTGTEASGGKEAKKAKSGGKSAQKSSGKKAAAPKLEEGSNGGSKAAQEVLHTAPGVKEAKPEAQVGEKCEKGTAGCSASGEFNGSFFGE
ncbi:MAG: zinc ribbon domain-containing protein [Actinobacteria bacterium]|nr:zinc ribbon domain-containing protein [Actinomycetota bacterium]